MSLPGAGLPVDTLSGSSGDETLSGDVHEIPALSDTVVSEDGSATMCSPDGPAEEQCPCLSNTDCKSGYCIQTAAGKVCTDTCVQECPEDWACEMATGFGVDVVYLCVPMNVNLCRPCSANDDCGNTNGSQGDRCVRYGDSGSFCGVSCEPGSCPEGTNCQEVVDVAGMTVQQCVPDTGACECSALAIEQGAETSCSVTTVDGVCEGKRYCGLDGLTECDAWFGDEICDGMDNDCDGLVDENTCAAANANTSSCVDGVCKILNCKVGFVDLDGDFETGCECMVSDEVCDGTDNDCDGQIDDGTLCGGGPGCSGLCINGTCECPGGCDFCNFQCIQQSNYGTDVNNCGYCGNTCDLPNTAIHKCDGGKCCPVVCMDGFKDCNGDCADGCEAAVSAEVCDGADNDCDGLLDEVPLADCPMPSTCVNGFCECDSSNPNLKKCDGQCTNIKEDVEHCGVCGNDCAALNVPNVLSFTCMDGKCVLGQCEPPFYDANQDIFDGCECQKTSMLEQCDMIDNDCDGVIDGHSQSCESECGAGSQVCVAGVWSECESTEPMPVEVCNGLDDNCNQVIDEGFICKAGELLAKPCGDQCGVQSYVCSNSCEWSELGECVPQGECKPGTTDTVACGQCGTKTRTCSAECGWSEYGECEEVITCIPGETETEPCGACGTRIRTCEATCQWSGYDSCQATYPCPNGFQCIQGNCECVPQCAGKSCGSDGCGGSCGTCPANHQCNGDQCVMNLLGFDRYWCPTFGNSNPNAYPLPGSADHFYTAYPQNENLNGYVLEAKNYFYMFSPGQAPAGTIPIYRYWNHVIGNHFYTKNGALGIQNYQNEGVIGYAWPGPGPNRIPIYGYFSPDPAGTVWATQNNANGFGDHFYSTQYQGSTVGTGPKAWKGGKVFWYSPTP